MLAHHGVAVGRRHARKHLGWALDTAAASVGTPTALRKLHRERVLTCEEPAKVRRSLAEAFDAFACGAAGSNGRTQAALQGIAA